MLVKRTNTLFSDFSYTISMCRNVTSILLCLLGPSGVLPHRYFILNRDRSNLNSWTDRIMEANYDENLLENIFLQELQLEHSATFQKAINEGWIICVPRSGSFTKGSFDENYFLNHILIPIENSTDKFHTLTNKDVKLCNKVLTIEYDITHTASLHLLFEEIFYTEDKKKYRVWCIEKPLEQNSTLFRDKVSVVTNLTECTDLLWTEVSNKSIIKDFKLTIEEFIQMNKNLECKSLQTQRDLVGALYTKCLCMLLKDTRLREKTAKCHYFLQIIKIAVETCVLHGLRKVLPFSISTYTSFEDARLNKIIKNLHELQPRDLGVRSDLYDGVLRGKIELSHLDQFHTVLGKIGCLKKTVRFVSQGKNSVSSDDLLPVLIFLVIKSGIPNWMAQLMFMKHFRFSSTSPFEADEVEFLITSLEAAIEHIRSGILVGSAQPEADNIALDKVSTSSKPSVPPKKDDHVTINYLFDRIIKDDLEEVQRILTKDKDWTESDEKLCHPLCTCESCETNLARKSRSDWPTVHSRDDRGLTALHVACLHGRVSIVDFLLSNQANVDELDADGATPKHYASARGHQNTLLLLLHANADPNIKDSRCNTALHFAADHGHEDCVKAILYFTEQMRIKVDINATNLNGDTALHHASKWGYAGIVQILLEYGADKDITNRRGLTPLAIAHSCHVTRLLERRSSQSAIPVYPLFPKSTVKNENRKRKKKVSFLEPNKESTIKDKKIDKLLTAVAEGDIHLVSYYLGLEASCVNSFTRDECQRCHPLCNCQKCIFVEEQQNLQEKKAEFGVNSCNDSGENSLHISSASGQVDIVQLLLDAGANINLPRSVDKRTALHLACDSDKIPVVKMLLNCGTCNVDARDSSGDTPLHLAIRDGNIKIVEILVRYGANLRIKNEKGLTIADEFDMLKNQFEQTTVKSIEKILKSRDF